MKMHKVLLLSFCSYASSLVAQNIIEPEMGEVEYSKLQATDGSDGDLVSERVVRSFKAIVPAREEAWIPLGHFEWGELHKLIVAAKGHSAHSNAEVTFSSGWRGFGTAIRTLNQYNTQGRFRLYWRPSYATGFGGGIRVFMKYKNISGSNNIVRIEHQGVQYNSWREDPITQEDIDEGIEMKGKIELQTGYTNYADYNLIRGTYLNDNVTVNGALNVNGHPVVTDLTFTPKLSSYLDSKSYVWLDPDQHVNADGINFGGAGGSSLSVDSSNDVRLDLENAAKLEVYSDTQYPVFLAGEGHEAEIPQGVAWYRIAQCKNAARRANAEFSLRDDISGGGHSTVAFRAGISYADSNRMGVTLLSHTGYAVPTFRKVRIVEANTYDQFYLEVEAYSNRATGHVRYSISDNLSIGGWEALDWIPVTAEVSEPYKAHTYNLDKLFMVGGSEEAFSVSRSGDVEVSGNMNISGEANFSVVGKDLPLVLSEQDLDSAKYYGPVQIGLNRSKVDFVFKRDPSRGASYINLPLGYIGKPGQVKLLATCVNSNTESAEFTLIGSRHRKVKCIKHLAYGAAKGFKVRGTMHHGQMWLWLDYLDEEGGAYSKVSQVKVSIEFDGGGIYNEEGERIHFDSVYREDLGYGNILHPVEMIDSLVIDKSESHGLNQLGHITEKKRTLDYDVEIKGDLKLSQPQGDISMGIFGE